MPNEIIHRRFLPHWYVAGAAHFITYRLAGTLPASAVQELQAWKDGRLRQKPSPDTTMRERRARLHKQWFALCDRHLDDNQSSIRWLGDARIAALVRSNLHYHHGSKYHLIAYCIMPNHVHVLLIPTTPVAAVAERETHAPIGEIEDRHSPLSDVMHSLKSYTANRANDLLGRTGRFWQPESFDHWVRDDDELERIVNYIRENPVKAKLVDRPENWYFSSCHDRFLSDGSTAGWLNWDTPA